MYVSQFAYEFSCAICSHQLLLSAFAAWHRSPLNFFAGSKQPEEPPSDATTLEDPQVVIPPESPLITPATSVAGTSLGEEFASFSSSRQNKQHPIGTAFALATRNIQRPLADVETKEGSSNKQANKATLVRLQGAPLNMHKNAADVEAQLEEFGPSRIAA